ncbi:hypothetical protein QN277_024974 [Acacia crassicarpa]|uniref:F-box domain-containing protein n=1 Tax=Acacia crassicarpa TaxID=499986 RepID=A0AAE1MNQ8_9FABA|nr:hypothetical protein QN277_024974 [Acacia crassicarpa]
MEKSESSNKMHRTEAEMRDRISDLPDSLLLHILSFLPAKEAVATSLLSKRWRPLWFSLPTLKLCRQDFQRFTFFHQFVGKILKLVDLKAVKKFVFECEYYKSRDYFRPQKISEWINAVILDKVEHLELNLYLGNNDYELPSNIFTTINIKVLKLSGGVTVGSTLSHVNLGLLQVLHLKLVKFPDFRSLGILLSGCVLLRDLVIRSLQVDGYSPLDIGGLNHLVTAELPHSLIPLRVLSNVTFLRLHTYNFTLGPDIPTFYNLTYLKFQYYPHDWETTLRLLHSCPKLEILVIQILCSQGLEPTADVPQCVSSNLKEFHLGNCCGKIEELKLARYIMKNAMVLRIISISKNSISRVTWKNRILKKIPLCPISSVNCKLLLLNRMTET